VLLDVFLNLACDNTVVLLDADRGRLYNECFWYFASLLVWYLDDGAVGNVWMGEKMCFQLGGCDLVALSYVSIMLVCA
jgi:hypothetical protein